MASGLAKRADSQIPYCEDQGIPYVAGAAAAGVGLQFASFTTDAAPDTFVFADNGLMNMANATYEVVPWNQTDVADQGVISSKTATQFVITGPDSGDTLTLIIVGKLAGQVS